MENFNFSDYFKAAPKKQNVVLLGGSFDKMISTSEIAEEFELKFNLCNKSVTNLSIRNAKNEYINNIEQLNPESILIHLGEADFGMFNKNVAEFDINFFELIFYIRSKNPKCRIGLVGLENSSHNANVEEMNKRIKGIADSEDCTYISLDCAKLWTPKATKKVFSFISQMNIEERSHIKKPLADIAEMIYGTFYAEKELADEDVAMRA